MTPDGHIDSAPGMVFGAAATLYDAGRPGYSDALVTTVLAYASLGGRAALEIGAGTGKATVAFAAHGLPLLCIEPDPRMAEVLRQNTAEYPDINIEVCGFEDWEPSQRRFGLVFAATSWHWLAPDRRWDLVHDVLEADGAVALFWNLHGVVDAQLHADLAALDERHDVVDSPHSKLARTYGDDAGEWGQGGGWPEAECLRDGRFTDLRSIRFHQDLHYDTDRYVAFLSSFSTYRILPETRRSQALADVAALLDTRGTGIDMHHVADLFLARRQAR